MSDHLSPQGRLEIEAAQAELAAANRAYEPFLGDVALSPGIDVNRLTREAMEAAQKRVEAAERALWELRERLLGWRRWS